MDGTKIHVYFFPNWMPTLINIYIYGKLLEETCHLLSLLAEEMWWSSEFMSLHIHQNNIDVSR